MDLEIFWRIIDESRNASEADLQVDFIREWLQQATDPEVLDFERILKTELLPESHSYLLSLAFASVYLVDWSDDTFDRLKAWLVLQGKESFYSVCDNPDDLVAFEAVRECESLLTLGDEEWRHRHGSPSPILLTRSPLKGEPQSQAQFEKLVFDDLEQTYPRLFRTCKPMMELQWHPRDRQLMHQLTDLGSKLDQVHVIDHFFICPTRNSADNVAKELKKLGHTVKVRRSGFNKCEVHSKEDTTLLSLTRRTQTLMDLAETFKASYDGWGTSV